MFSQKSSLFHLLSRSFLNTVNTMDLNPHGIPLMIILYCENSSYSLIFFFPALFNSVRALPVVPGFLVYWKAFDETFSSWSFWKLRVSWKCKGNFSAGSLLFTCFWLLQRIPADLGGSDSFHKSHVYFSLMCYFYSCIQSFCSLLELQPIWPIWTLDLVVCGFLNHHWISF